MNQNKLKLGDVVRHIVYVGERNGTAVPLIFSEEYVEDYGGQHVLEVRLKAGYDWFEYAGVIDGIVGNAGEA